MKSNLKFIVDNNVGKLARWLRIMGYDTLLFNDSDDARMIATALTEERVILTRDTQIMKIGVIESGRLRAILIQSDKPEEQISQVVESLDLDTRSGLFTVCLECNRPLETRTRQLVKERVPPYVFRTQNQYVECPECHRIYWKGTHWQAMTRKLEKLRQD